MESPNKIQHTAQVKITVKNSTTGYQATLEAEISPEQWGDINAVIEGKLKSKKPDEA